MRVRGRERVQEYSAWAREREREEGLARARGRLNGGVQELRFVYKSAGWIRRLGMNRVVVADEKGS